MQKQKQIELFLRNIGKNMQNFLSKRSDPDPDPDLSGKINLDLTGPKSTGSERIRIHTLPIDFH